MFRTSFPSLTGFGDQRLEAIPPHLQFLIYHFLETSLAYREPFSMGLQCAVESLSTVAYNTLRDLPTAEGEHVLRQIRSIERSAFPPGEAFDLSSTNIFRSHTQVVFISQENDGDVLVIAYAVCVRARRTLLLHKLCVTAAFRGQGIGKGLLLHVKGKAKSANCREIHIWVDESRAVARSLYQNCGFSERRRATDYYAAGRHAINMTCEP